MWKNHIQPQQPGASSSCCSPASPHTAVVWHPILQPASSQSVWLRWSLWNKQHAQADSKGVQWNWGSLQAGHCLKNPALWGKVLSRWVLETQNKNIRISCLHWQRSGTDWRCIYWSLLLLFNHLSFSFYPFRWDRSVVEPSQGSHRCRTWAPQMCEAGQASLRACAWAMLRDPQEEHPEIQQLHIPHRVRVSPPAATCNISIKI